jgi:hypothetical protein
MHAPSPYGRPWRVLTKTRWNSFQTYIQLEDLQLSLTVFGCQAALRRYQLGLLFRVNRLVVHLSTCGVCPQIILANPIFGWPNGSWYETTAAIGAYVMQDSICTVRTECAFIAANASQFGMRRQSDIAVFAGRSKL